MRPIDADKLDGVLENIWAHLEESGTVVNGKLSTIAQYFMEVVKNQPTIDPAKHGRWLRPITMVVDWTVQCSICRIDSQRTTPYCPNCGAKMDS